MQSPPIPPSNAATTEWLAWRFWERSWLRKVFFCCAWIFITFVQAYDTYFAWKYREFLNLWEMNPFILWLAGCGGLASVFTFKLTTIFFSRVMAVICHRHRHQWEIPFTVVEGAVYFALSLHYLMSNCCA